MAAHRATRACARRSQQVPRFVRQTGGVAELQRILVVDDERDLRELLTTSLRFAGFEVEAVASGNAALAAVTNFRPALVVLDVMMPDMDGFTVTRRLRARGDHLPVLFLTARGEADDAVHGLTVGGDDYVTKPFSLAELVARIHAILRRSAPAVPDSSLLSVGDLVVDDDAHEASRAGQPLDLSPTEFLLLRYLMENAGRVVSKAQILDHVWNYSWDGDGAIVETYISYLRKKVDAPFEVPLLHTKRGIGYMLREPS